MRRPCCEVLSIGFYSCKWKKAGYLAGFRTSAVEKLFFAILTFIFVFAIIWLYAVSVFENDSNEVDWFFFQELDSWFSWYLIVIIISVLIMTYLLMLMLTGLYNIFKKSLKMCIFHKVFIFFCLFIMIAGLVAIDLFYPEIWPLISASFDATGFFLQIFGTVVWTSAAILLSLLLRKSTNVLVRVSSYVAYFALFIFLLTIPLWTNSPCINSGAFLNPKPLLIGHRGAPTQAPENTILSFEKAIENCDISVLESDVRISFDGVPFLLHDDTLLRTTNVEEIFPSRKKNRAETFTWEELQMLNAGEWFLKTNPFLTNVGLTEAEKSAIRSQKIPLLADYIKLAAQNNRSIIFDLMSPPVNNQFYKSYVNLTLNVMLNWELPQENVIWIESEDSIDLVKERAPGFRIASRDFQEKGINIFNILFSSVRQISIPSNQSVISYTINNNWAFTRAWCQGVWAVTTNQCERFKNTNKPSWKLNNSQYLAAWVTIDILCIIFVITIIFIFEKNRSKTTAVQYSLESSSDNDIWHISLTQQTLVL